MGGLGGQAPVEGGRGSSQVMRVALRKPGWAIL